MNEIEIVKFEVAKLLGEEKSGHDDSHIFRVYDMAMKFCETESAANKDIVGFAALLHDCDDIKIFEPSKEKLPNANRSTPYSATAVLIVMTRWCRLSRYLELIVQLQQGGYYNVKQ